MTLTVPRAGFTAGRAADIRVEAPQTGAAIAEFGDVMMRVGTALEADRLDRARSRAKLDMMKGLQDLSLELEAIGDPDTLDAAWTQRSAELRERLTAGLDPKLAPDAGLMFDELAFGHQSRVGMRALEARQSQRRAINAEMYETTVRAAATGDAQTREAYLTALDEDVDAMVAAGAIDAERAGVLKRAARREADETLAIRMLSDDPAGLIRAIDAGGMPNLAPDQRERFRGQAANAERVAAERTTATADVERRRFVAEAKDLLRTGASILNDTTSPFARTGEIDALLAADPEIAALPEARAWQSAVALRDQMPGFAMLPLDQKRRSLAAFEARPIAERHEADLGIAMRAAIDKHQQALAGDFWGWIGATYKAEVPALPDPASASPRLLAAALAGRRADAEAWRDRGMTAGRDAPIFTPAEREVWSERVKVANSPADRLRLARTFVEALDDDATRAAEEIGADRVLLYAGSLVAATGDEALGRRILEGQRAAAAGDLSLPGRTELRELFFETNPTLFNTGVDGYSDDSPIRDDIIDAANALYAIEARDRVGEMKDGQIDADLWLLSLHRVLGGTGSVKNGFVDRSATGGIKTVNGRPVLVPPGMRHTEFDGLRDRIAIGTTEDGWDWGRVTQGGVPVVAGRPLDERTFMAMQLAQVPGEPPGIYTMRTPAGEIVRNARGEIVFLDLGRAAVALTPPETPPAAPRPPLANFGEGQ